MVSRTVVVFRLVLPALWLGLLLGLAFIEAPLKFTAPGITTALGLGIGRIVFFALEMASWVILIAVGILGFARPKHTRAQWIVWAATAVVMLVQTLAIRPPLNARSDVIIAGGDPGESALHYLYIATDLALVVLIVWMLVQTARRDIRVAAG